MKEYNYIAFRAAVETLLWSELDDNDRPFDQAYDSTDIHHDSLKCLKDDINDFIESNGLLIGEMNAEQLGHDFILTRNGHGTGFWDRGLGERGDKLTIVSESYGTISLYIGDDQFLHII